MNNITIAFLLTSIAGLSTMLGTIIIFYKNNNYNKIIVSSLSFSAAVMICISICELIPESLIIVGKYYNFFVTCIISFLFIIIGIIISMLIEYKMPSSQKLYKVAIVSMLAIIIHNIPEGIATFIATSSNVNLGLTMSLAIAMHNIPEGIVISVPIYYSTGSKKKALLYTCISSLSEPFGAIITYLFLKKFVTIKILGFLFSIIAGIMIYISLYELIPSAKSYKIKKNNIIFFGLGCIFFWIYFIIFG